MKVFFKSKVDTYFSLYKQRLSPGENVVADDIGIELLTAHSVGCKRSGEAPRLTTDADGVMLLEKAAKKAEAEAKAEVDKTAKAKAQLEMKAKAQAEAKARAKAKAKVTVPPKKGAK